MKEKPKSSELKSNLVMDLSESSWVAGLIPGCETPRFPYSRPDFLYLTSSDEIAVSGDQATRPVLVPKDPLRMPLYAGYAETINAGKTEQNEDQATARILSVTSKFTAEHHQKELPQQNAETGVDVASTIPSASSDLDDELITIASDLTEQSLSEKDCVHEDAVFFGLFDGHAGVGAALMASNCLHEHVRLRLSRVLETIYQADKQEELLGYVLSNRHPAPRINGISRNDSSFSEFDCSDLAVLSLGGKSISRDALVCGALETAFAEMDEQIQHEKTFWRIPGGCAALVALFFMRRLYIANVGDCRAVVFCHGQVEQLSTDFTPANNSERKRLQHIAAISSDLLGKHYTRLEYSRHVTKKDLGKRVLYRDWFMDGWAQKVVKEIDVREPLISDCVKKPRLLSTIGVTRGFGDHHLVTVEHNVFIKPFLSAVPEVSIFNLRKYADDLSRPLTDKDVLILATDGLWDVVSNEEAANIVDLALSQYPEDDVTKYTLAAQDLVAFARGQPGSSGHGWLPSKEGTSASYDDIAVFVIPLKLALTPPPPEDDEEPLSLE